MKILRFSTFAESYFRAKWLLNLGKNSFLTIFFKKSTLLRNNDVIKFSNLILTYVPSVAKLNLCLGLKWRLFE